MGFVGVGFRVGVPESRMSMACSECNLGLRLVGLVGLYLGGFGFGAVLARGGLGCTRCVE